MSPNSVAITPDGQFAYVTNIESNDVSVIETTSNTVIATVPVGRFPQGVAIAPTVPFSAFNPDDVQIANYTLTLPTAAFHQPWKAANAPYGYDGTVNGTTVRLVLTPLGNNTFAFDAAGSPVTFPGIKHPATVTLTFGTDTGTTSVKALITSF